MDQNAWSSSIFYEVKDEGNTVVVTCNTSAIKEFPKEVKKFKQVFKKAAYCQGCRVCETNCRNGCISFDGGLSISNCVHCGQCHDLDDGCLLYHSIKKSKGDGNMRKGSINSFANHAPKPDWIQEFLIWAMTIGRKETTALAQIRCPCLKVLRESGLIDQKNNTSSMFDIVSSFGWQSNTTWGLILANLSYNTQCRWYIENMDVGMYYERARISDMLVLDGVKKMMQHLLLTHSRDLLNCR